MNMQKLMQEAKKMQTQLLKDQEELDKTMYEGKSQMEKLYFLVVKKN